MTNQDNDYLDNDVPPADLSKCLRWFAYHDGRITGDGEWLLEGEE